MVSALNRIQLGPTGTGFRVGRRSKARMLLPKLAKLRRSQVKPVKTKVIHEVAAESKLEPTPDKVNRISMPKLIEATNKITTDVLSKLRSVKEEYPLVTVERFGAPFHLARAQIIYNPTIQHLEYFVIEPQLTKQLQEVVDQTLEEFHEGLDIDFQKLEIRREVYTYMDKQIQNIWHELGIHLNPDNALKVKYYIFREALGLGNIDALMQDPNIEDISCDGVNLPVFIFHRNPMYGEIPTNIRFSTKEDLDAFVMKLAQKAGRTVSVASPLLDGALPDGSRVQITYGTDIARKGSNFTIRKFFRVPLTPIDLMNYGTIDALTLAYLWLAIEKERSILISGSTATGKTTMLNALSLFIEPGLKIVSIEDTAEIQLPHINWMPHITRSGYGPTSYGEISMYDLLKAALRQRPDYLIVGEVRGREASVLFHAMATGHPGMSTLHADNIEAVIDRLTTRPIDLPVALLENLDIIIFLEKVKKEGKFTRKVGQIIEIEGYDSAKSKLKTNQVVRGIATKSEFEQLDSKMLHDLASQMGWSDADVKEELMRRASILVWLKEKGIYRFNDVAEKIQMYYANPRKLAKLMGS